MHIRLDPVRLEADVSEAISQRLSGNGIRFEREAVLSPGCRVDFLTETGVAIEIKKGKPNTAVVARQLDRYAASSRVTGIILVSERGLVTHIDEANGKPVKYIAMTHNWGLVT